MSEGESDTVLLQWYRNRIAEPRTDDEVYGYWLFVFGVIIGVLGVMLAGSTAGQVGSTFARLAGIALGGVGLIFLLLGPVIRLPLPRRATQVAYVGAAISIVAIVWLVLTFQGGRAGRAPIFALYGIGMAVIAFGAVVFPLLSESDEGVAPSRETEAARAEAESARGESERLEGEVADLETALEQQEAALAEVEAELAERYDSQATFELYEDAAEKYRWRLRHRNGNIIADGAQGYTRKASAQNGIQSVMRNALGGDVLDLREELDEEEADEGEEGVVPYAAGESKATFEVYEDEAGEYRWRLVHDNGNNIANSAEGYTRKADAQEAVERVAERVGPAGYLKPDPTAYEVYEDAAEEWRWRLVHKNGRVLADSGEGYASRGNARKAVDRVREYIEEERGEFETYEDAAGEARWRLVADNGEIIADSGEGFTDEAAAEDSIERVTGHSPAANVLDIGLAAFEVYEDQAAEWRWRLRARNGEILAASGEGYTERNKAYDAITSVKRNAPNAESEAA